MSVIGVILNVVGPLKELGTYSTSAGCANTVSCDAKCVSTDVISYAEFRTQMVKYDIAAVVLQLTSSQRHLVEELHYVAPAMDTFLFIDMHKLFAEEPVITAEYTYEVTSETRYSGSVIFYEKKDPIYEVASIYELAYHTPSEYYLLQDGQYIPCTDEAFDISKTYYMRKEVYEAIGIVDPSEHTPSEYFVLQNGEYIPCTDESFSANKSYYSYSEEDDEYSVVPLLNTAIPVRTVYYQQFTNTNQVTTWEQLEAYLNGLEDDIFSKFIIKTLVPRTWTTKDGVQEETPFYSNITTELKVRSVENTHGLEVEYGDHKKPNRRSTSGIPSDYPDLVIRNSALTDTIDLDNSVPIVNGSVFYPSVWTNLTTNYKEMFAQQAGKWLYHSDWNQGYFKTAPHLKVPTTKLYHTNLDIDNGGYLPLHAAATYNKNIMLVDFSSLGTIDKIRLCDCVNGTVQGEETESSQHLPVASDRISDPHHAWLKGKPLVTEQCSYYTIDFDLPAGTTPGTPIVVICGRMFFINEHVHMQNIAGTIHLSVTIDKSLFRNIIASNLQWFGKQYEGTDIVETVLEPTLNELFVDTSIGHGTPEDVYRMMYEDFSVPFVIMVHSKKKLVLSHIQPRMTIGPDKFLFPPHIGGLFMNKRTREIIDYTRTMYGRSTLVTTTTIRQLNKIENGFQRTTAPNMYHERLQFHSKSKYLTFTPSHKQRDISQYEMIDIAYME